MADRLHKTPEEVRAMPYADYCALLMYYHLENEEATKARMRQGIR